jgi:hypothetical protein
MPARRNRGEGALYWDESRQRWMAAVDVGFSPMGRGQRRWVSRKTKTEPTQSCSRCVGTNPMAFRSNTGPTPYEAPLSPGLNMA